MLSRTAPLQAASRVAGHVTASSPLPSSARLPSGLLRILMSPSAIRSVPNLVMPLAAALEHCQLSTDCRLSTSGRQIASMQDCIEASPEQQGARLRMDCLTHLPKMGAAAPLRCCQLSEVPKVQPAEGRPELCRSQDCLQQTVSWAAHLHSAVCLVQ